MCIRDRYYEKKRSQKQEQHSAFLQSIANKIKELPEFQNRQTEKFKSFGSSTALPKESELSSSKKPPTYNSGVSKYRDKREKTRTASIKNKVESYEADFAYKSIIPESGMKTYLSPVFQDSNREERKIRKADTNPEKDLLMALSLIHISEPTRALYIPYAVFCLKIIHISGPT